MTFLEYAKCTDHKSFQYDCLECGDAVRVANSEHWLWYVQEEIDGVWIRHSLANMHEKEVDAKNEFTFLRAYHPKRSLRIIRVAHRTGENNEDAHRRTAGQ